MEKSSNLFDKKFYDQMKSTSERLDRLMEQNELDRPRWEEFKKQIESLRQKNMSNQASEKQKKIDAHLEHLETGDKL